MHGFCYQVSGCIHSLSEQRLPKDENDQQKLNRQREGYCITKKDATCNISDRKSLLNELLFSVEDSLKYNKPQQKTTLFCFGSFVFS